MVRDGDIELVAYLVLDLRITHERWGCSSDPSLNGHLHYPNDLAGPLNEDDTDKILQFRADYNNRPRPISFMPAIASTSGHLHCEFVLLLFFQTHRETDHFFAASQEFNLAIQHHVPLPSHGVLLTAQVESGTYPCKDGSPTY